MKPNFAKIARDMFADACGEVTHVEIENVLRNAYNAGLERAAVIAEARHEFWRMPHPDDARPFEVCDDISACADIAAAIRAEKEKA